MGISVARLRVGLVVGVALLALVVAGFLGYARYKAHRFLAGLPGKLGIDIRRETNGYTYSQSVGGKTVMTLHAAKAVEHNDGKITLHDVSMMLYGRKQDRADRISGSEFEYEQATGVVRAVGEVHIDLQAPEPESRERPAAATGKDEGKSIIHVKTSGLVYLQRLGVAATDQELEFRFGGMTGYAKGAEYNSDTGMVILQSAVKASGLQRGRPVALTASHAELDRRSQVALLTDAMYATPGQTARGDHATLHLRGDGSPERIEAEGHVAVDAPGDGTVSAPRADLLLNAAGQAQGVHFFGGVTYLNMATLREGHGQAEEARVAFDAAGRPETVALDGAVQVGERVRTDAPSPWTTREATAGRMTFALVNVGTGKRQELRQAEAVGGAHVTLVSEDGTAKSATSELSGDLLRGDFVASGGKTLLAHVHASGHTLLRRRSAEGAEQTSAGETLEADLRQAGARTKQSGHGAGAEGIAKAVQSGHVVLTSREPAQPGQPTPASSKGTAEVAVYDGDTDRLTLTGHARVVDEQGTVAAARIVLEQGSGDATAEGTVKATYLQANSADKQAAANPVEPVHVLADHAELQHDAQRAIFYGAAKAEGGRPARLWQGAAQVEAPVIDLEQAAGRLTARGEENSGDTTPVHAVLVSQESGEAKRKPLKGPPPVVRVASRTMVYLDGSRQVEFTGEVKVEDAEGTILGREATAYLSAENPSGSSGGAAASKVQSGTARSVAQTGSLLGGGSVDRIVAKGKVELEQPGRRAAGEQLVYTASDGQFVLTGTEAVPPRLIDETQGTVTGTSLSFHNSDRSVVVAGTSADAGRAVQRAHTVTRVKQP